MKIKPFYLIFFRGKKNVYVIKYLPEFQEETVLLLEDNKAGTDGFILLLLYSEPPHLGTDIRYHSHFDSLSEKINKLSIFHFSVQKEATYITKYTVNWPKYQFIVLEIQDIPSNSQKSSIFVYIYLQILPAEGNNQLLAR